MWKRLQGMFKLQKMDWPDARLRDQWGSCYSTRHAFSYAWDTGEWSRVNSHSTYISQEQQVTLITWNVWFDKFMFDKRVAEIIRIIVEKDADLVCLQEVTPRFVQFLCKDEEIRKKYVLSDVDGASVNPYGVLMMSKFKVDAFHNFAFPESGMGRSLLCSVFQLEGKESKFAITTSHLESLDYNSNSRIEQMRLSFEILSTFKHSVICGDFNFSSEWLENSHIPSDFIDIWPHLHPEESGFTMPECGRFSAWRPDRILLSSTQIIAEEIERIGFDPLDYPEITPRERSRCVLTPSDHQGLYCKFKVL